MGTTEPRRGRRMRRTRKIALSLAIGLGLALVASNVAQVRARVKALAVVVKSVGYPFPRPFANRVSVRRVRLAPGVDGDLYDPGVPAPVIVLVPGGTRLGAEDPGIVSLARTIAGARREVFVPQLELRNQTFVWSDVVAIERAVLALSRTGGGRNGDRTVGLLGISYGGSFAMLAAQDARVAPALTFVAVFGSYFDLVDVVQGITTGATLSAGRAVPWTPSPQARSILTNAAMKLTPAAERASLANALRARDPTGLAHEALAAYRLLENTDPRATPALVAALPAAFRATLARFSPSTHIRALTTPLFIMQSSNDPATPPTEANLLHAAVQGSRLILLTHFVHVRPGAASSVLGKVADAWGAWTFVTWVLAAQE